MNDKFWSGQASEEYTPFATTLPSDKIAYSIVHKLLLAIPGRIVLDFGCFKGASSRSIMVGGAGYVLGIDKVMNYVEEAAGWATSPSSQFQYVPVDGSIKTDRRFDAVAMTFVHPTISTHAELEGCFQKIARVARSGADLVVLGLAPASFNPKCRFLFYGHNRKSPRFDGEPFENELRKPDGQTLRFTDYFWNNRTLTRMMEAAGCIQAKVMPVTRDTAQPLRGTLESAIAEQNVEWRDEWSAPLYQIIHAVRDGVQCSN